MDDKAFELTDLDETKKQGSAFVEGSVDPRTLKVVSLRPSPSAGEPIRMIEVPERYDLHRFLSVVTAIISFLTDVPIRYSLRFRGDELLTDSSEDINLLNSFGTDQVRVHSDVRILGRSFSLSEVSQHRIELLSRKETGLELYSQALLAQHPAAQFRELWRVLESASGQQGDELVRTLADYRPVKELGFTHKELNELLVLRGRASHAKSRSGIREQESVTGDTLRRVVRLKCLVEQVLLTKKTWGNRSLETQRIAEMKSYVDGEGNLVLIKGA